MPSSSSDPEREWILIGMAESCAERGYEATKVADVCAAAGVSPKVFDRWFANKRECLGAAMELIVEEGQRKLEWISSPRRSWEQELRDGVIALLRMLAERPDFAHIALIEAQADAGRAGALHHLAKGALAAQVGRGRERAKDEVPASAARAVLTGVETLLVSRILAGKGRQLGRLAPEAIYLLAVPYLGRGEAQQLASEAIERPALRAVA